MGKADDPLERWKVHCGPNKRCPHKSAWVSELRSLGLTPELEILEEIPMEGWQEIEKEYIRVFRMVGIRLTNLADGGDGGAIWAGRRHTEETKEKMRLARTGKFLSPETKEKIAASKRGKKTWLGRCHTADTKLKIRLAKLGTKVSNEAREKISAALKGNQHCLGNHPSLETRKRMSESHLGSKRSEITKQKMREAWVRRKAGGIFLF